MRRLLVLGLAMKLGVLGMGAVVVAQLHLVAASARMARPAGIGPNAIWAPVPQSVAPRPSVMQTGLVRLAIAFLVVIVAVVTARIASGRARASTR